MVEVIDGGFFTTIQDQGRFGYRRLGIPASGPMDAFHAQLANTLVGNSTVRPLLELTFEGGVFKFRETARIVLTGASMPARVNAKKLPFYEMVEVSAGSELQLGYCTQGVRTYLAIQGEWQVSKQFGSCSTHSISQLGGLDGNPLKAGDVLSIKQTYEFRSHLHFPPHLKYVFEAKPIIRLIRGPEWSYLDPEAERTLMSTDMQLDAQSDRMGLRVNASSALTTSSQLPASASIFPGAVQLTAPGNLIISMMDGQVTGGYPRIAQVIAADLGRLAQIRPRQSFTFRLVSLEEARKQVRIREEILGAIQ